MARYRWVEPVPVPDWSFAETDFPLLAAILARRGITADDLPGFLHPCLERLNDPSTLPDLDQAVSLVRRTIAAGQPIAVFGDYDVDGLTGAAILTRVLRSLGADVRTRVPHRMRDGYGLNPAAMARIIGDGAALLIAVDCGTGDAAELQLARAAGVETVVIDHHHVHTADLPASAFVSPRRPESRYPFSGLAAAGLAYQFARALRGGHPGDDLLALAALGTVADVAPLLGDNRIIVYEGLARFTAAPPGLRALAIDAGLDPGAIRSWHCAFVLGPRVNAAGRIGDPDTALDLLLTDDGPRAARLARALGTLNAQRQRVMEEMVREAEAQLRAKTAGRPPLLMLAHDEWSVGMVGLVASRLVDRYQRPAIVLARGDNLSRGSARSIDGFNIVEALAECQDLLVEHGGHSHAAGLTVETGHLVELEERLVARLRLTFGSEIPPPTLRLDAELHPTELTLATEHLIASLEPLGAGNPAPVFLSRGLSPTRVRTSRDGKHLMFDVSGSRGPVTHAVFFHGASRAEELRAHGRIDLAFTLRRDNWDGQARLELEVVDFRPPTAP